MLMVYHEETNLSCTRVLIRCPCTLPHNTPHTILWNVNRADLVQLSCKLSQLCVYVCVVVVVTHYSLSEYSTHNYAHIHTNGSWNALS